MVKRYLDRPESITEVFGQSGTLQKIEEKQQADIHGNHTAEPTNYPRAQRTLPAGEEQRIAHIHGDVADNCLYAASRDNQHRHAPLQQVQDEGSDVAETRDEREQVQSARAGIDQRVVRQDGEDHEQHGENQCHLELQRVAAVFVFSRLPAVPRPLPPGVQVPCHAGRDDRHNQQIRIDGKQRLPAEDAYQYQEPEEHHADGKQHSRHIFGRVLRRGGTTLPCQHGNGGGAAVESAHNARHQDARLTEDISFQQIRKVRDAGHDHSRQPDAVRGQVDAGNQVVIGEHRQDDAADGEELGKGYHLVVLHPLRQFGEGVLQLGEEQHGHDDHDVEPRRLRIHDGGDAVGDERNDDGSHPEDMELHLLHVVVQPEQQAQDGATTHEEAVLHRVEDVEQIA